MPRDVSSVSWNFHDLMLHRVHEILLLSSPYDAFILEEDGRLTEQIMHEYLGINLRYAPRVWRVSTAADAMDMLRKRKINLVITMLRVSDMDPISFGRQVKEKYPDMPVVLLVYDTPQIKHLPNPLPGESIDKVFIWTGNAKVLMAIIKDIEDHRNVDRDIKKADVRALIYIEDDPYYYSVIMPLIYSEIYYHTRNLLDKSLNDTHRLLRMRGRPKILMCRSYEEAEEYVTKYREN
ncbi:MAG: response regulator, partial [Candidatus Marinimicrobia bacterium]|nr:response regulator [Candidatus Neomarinimicrobiota bacterium]